jgi:very-short-patch-repair endonuclease
MYTNRITNLCRELRQNETFEEALLWQKLKAGQLSGYKFRRQHPFIYSVGINEKKFFIADLYCAEKKLIIEIDGKYHLFQKHYDENRDAILLSLGLQTIRVTNEVVRSDVNKVISIIKQALQ